MRILIAEDDYTTRLMLQVILEKWKYKVETAEDGNEAWTILQQSSRQPQIAILDWEMPEMDGLEVCEKIRTLDRRNPIYIIMLTGRDTTSDIVHGLDAGADDYITKPFDENELRARVRVAERMVTIQESLASTVEELRLALDHVDTLQGILPICMHCHGIRSDDEAWHKLERYIETNTMAKFSHSICPDCLIKHYSDDMK
ncbi:MAG TPA: response regulator transcription factor [Desulfopila sp.]|nr:response regulator transcription factor [Desulfopila sp.]